jgi:hypothetical protein
MQELRLMKKDTIWIIAGVAAVLLICCVGTTAVYYIYTRSIISTPTAPTPFIFPTPNSTLTALYRLPTLSLPTATQWYIAPTYFGGPTSTGTAVAPTFSWISPSQTNTPGVNRSSGLAEAQFLSAAPVLDGIWDEWTAAEYPINVVVYGRSAWEGSNDLAGSYKIGWDYTNLYLAVKVTDDKYTQVSTGEYIYMGDSLEVLLDTNLTGDLTVRRLNGDDYQIGISPGRITPGSNKEAYLWYPVSLTGARSSIQIAAVGGDGIYRVEIAIPWSVLNIAPYRDLIMGFAVSISDDDLSGTAKQQTMISSSPSRSLADPTTWGTLTLK